MKDFRILGWKLNEVEELLSNVTNRGEKSLLQVFDEFAQKTQRKSLSVRNFYYKILQLAENDNEIGALLNANELSKNIRNIHFNCEDTLSLLRVLLRNDRNISVRKACFELAEGDEKLMIRYQNKYRNALKQNPELVQQVLNELREQNFRVRDVKIDNISVMPSQKRLITDKEIQSLFWGLVRLVKKSAEQDLEETLKREAEFANTTLQNSLIDLRRKEMLIKELKEQNIMLKSKLKSLENRLEQSQEKMLGNMATISNLVGKSKLDELKNFIKQLNLNEKTLNR